MKIEPGKTEKGVTNLGAEPIHIGGEGDGPQPLSPQNSDDPPEVAAVDAMFRNGEREIADVAPMIRTKTGRPPGRKDSKKRRAPKPFRYPGEKEPEAPEAAAEPENSQPPAKLGDYLPIASMLAGVPFDLAARKTGFEGFRLDEKEISTLAPPIDAVLVKYFPHLSANTPELVLAGTILGIFYTHYIAYLDYQKEKLTNNEKTTSH